MRGRADHPGPLPSPAPVPQFQLGACGPRRERTAHTRKTQRFAWAASQVEFAAMRRFPLAPEPDPVVVAWLETLDLIQDDIQELLFRRLIFRRLREIVEANPKLDRPSLLYTYLQSTYAASSAAGVRRRARQDDERRDASLIGLLFDIRRTPEVLTRSRHVAMYEAAGVSARIAEAEFDKISPSARPISSVNMYAHIELAGLYRCARALCHAAHRTSRRERATNSPTFASWTWRSTSLNGSSDAMSCSCGKATPCTMMTARGRRC